MSLKPSTLSRYVSEVDRLIKNVAFGAGGCVAWYNNERGVNWTLYPKDLVSFWWETLGINDDEWEFK